MGRRGQGAGVGQPVGTSSREPSEGLDEEEGEEEPDDPDEDDGLEEELDDGELEPEPEEGELEAEDDDEAVEPLVGRVVAPPDGEGVCVAEPDEVAGVGDASPDGVDDADALLEADDDGVRDGGAPADALRFVVAGPPPDAAGAAARDVTGADVAGADPEP